LPTLNYTLPYKVNTPLVMSVDEFDAIYLFGIDFKDEFGNSYSQDAKEYHILNAQESLEDMLGIKLKRQVIQEKFDYNHVDFRNWAYLRTTYPVECAMALDGFVGGSRQISYPQSWLSTRQTNDKDIGYFRKINIVPGGSSVVDFTQQAAYSSQLPIWGYGNGTIPNYFTVSYVTGMTQVPRDIFDAVGKLAAIDAMNVLGDIAIGAGIASQSLSIDGLSQSVNTTQSAENNALSARVRQYAKEMEKGLPALRDRYMGYLIGGV
jgi:hypothetical protein